MRIPVVACVLLVAVACSGGDEATAPGSAPAADASVLPAQPRHREGPPAATMQAGTDSVDGALVRWCEREDDCTDRRGTPQRALWLTEDRLLLFALSDVPEDATVHLRKGGRTLESGPLLAGDLMSYAAGVGRGRYDVFLRVSWGQRSAVWLFSLRVAKGV